MPGQHARLSASSAHRWLACPGSIYLEGLFPDEQTSEYAEEGTRAHALSEQLLTAYLNNDEEIVKNIEANADVDPEVKEMYNNILTYVNYAMDIYHQLMLTHTDTTAYVELRLDYSKWVPKGYGTGDFILIADSVLHIMDLKYGKGVVVDAKENPQTRLYGLGALSKFDWLYPIKDINMHIIQPRLNHITVESLTTEELVNWANKFVKPKAKVAMSSTNKDYKHTYVPGTKQCRFCKAKSTCKARTESILKILNNL